MDCALWQGWIFVGSAQVQNIVILFQFSLRFDWNARSCERRFHLRFILFSSESYQGWPAFCESKQYASLKTNQFSEYSTHNSFRCLCSHSPVIRLLFDAAKMAQNRGTDWRYWAYWGIASSNALWHEYFFEKKTILRSSGILKFFDRITLTVVGWTVLSSQAFFGPAIFLRWKTINGLELSKVQKLKKINN